MVTFSCKNPLPFLRAGRSGQRVRRGPKEAQEGEVLISFHGVRAVIPDA